MGEVVAGNFPDRRWYEIFVFGNIEKITEAFRRASYMLCSEDWLSAHYERTYDGLAGKDGERLAIYRISAVLFAQLSSEPKEDERWWLDNHVGWWWADGAIDLTRWGNEWKRLKINGSYVKGYRDTRKDMYHLKEFRDIWHYCTEELDISTTKNITAIIAEYAKVNRMTISEFLWRYGCGHVIN